MTAPRRAVPPTRRPRSPRYLGHWNFPAESPWCTREATGFPAGPGDFAASWASNSVHLILAATGTTTLYFGASPYPSNVYVTRAVVSLGYVDPSTGHVLQTVIFDREPDRWLGNSRGACRRRRRGHLHGRQLDVRRGGQPSSPGRTSVEALSAWR